MLRNEYDAIVVGSGPNGFAAAITLQQAGLQVLLLEGKETVGGGTRTAELTLPGYMHDVCAAVHPLALVSPFFRSIPLQQYGLEFVQPPLSLAHPLGASDAVALYQDVAQTASALGEDAKAYISVMAPLVKRWPMMVDDILAPLKIPKHPLWLAQFAMQGIRPMEHMIGRFRTEKAKSLFAGLAAHACRPLNASLTSAVGLVLAMAGHSEGWPIVRGGSQQLAHALLAHFIQLGGVFETSHPVTNLQSLPPANVVLFDVTPRQLLAIAGRALSPLYRRQLMRYRYGMGVFKIDWALRGPVPFRNPLCLQAGTVHLGGTFEEIKHSEWEAEQGRNSDRPFVLFSQQSKFDRSRVPGKSEAAWAYCHVPHGSFEDRTEAIERQVERFAPGFRDLILERHTMNTAVMESYNPNYIGGDIGGGAITPVQLLTRPAVRFPVYRTSNRRLYLCSSSTPPGGGVHGMCGYHAARAALRDMRSTTA